MIATAANAYRGFLIRWVEGVRRSAAWVMIAAVIAAATTVYLVSVRLAINTDTADMLSSELPFRQDSIALSRAFPQFSDNILIVIDGLTPDIADDAARTLAAGLQGIPEIFQSVYDSQGAPFFRRNGLLFLEPKALADLSDNLATAQPLLGTLSRDPSLIGLFDVFGLVIEEQAKGVGEAPIELDFAFDSITNIVEAQMAGRPAWLSWHELMEGEPSSAAERRRFLLVRPILDFGSLRPATKAIDEIRRQARAAGLDRDHGVRVRLTGSAVIAHVELKSVQEGLGVAAVVSLTLVLGLLFWGLRSARLVLATLTALILGLIWTGGFAVLAVERFNLISVAFAVLFIGLSVDFGIHFALRYKEEIDQGIDHAEALRRAASSVGGALTLCAVAAAIGVFSFLPTAYRGLAELGLIAGAGMFIALFANLTIVAAVTTLVPSNPGKRRVPQKAFAAQQFVQTHYRIIALGALGLALASAATLPWARFDFDPINLRNPKTESVATLLDLMEDRRTSPYSITVLAQSLDAGDALAGRIGGLPEVDETITLSNYVPAAQTEKLEAIESMAMFILPSLAATGDPRPPTADRRRQAFSKFRRTLEMANAVLRDWPGRAAILRLGDALRRFERSAGLGDGAIEQPRALEELETRLLLSLPNRLEALRESLDAKAVNLAALPEALRRREMAADGRVRVHVLPKADLRDRDALREFVGAVRAIAPRATGAPVVIFEAGRTVVRAFVEAGILSVALISLLVVVLARRVKDSLLVFAPLGLAALLTVAATVVLDLAFNFANVVVLPLLFGLGVASAIHLVMRERAEAASDGLMRTSTPRAVLFSSLTTIGSFGSIAISSHPGTASMGILLTIAIALTLICSLVVLPALMALWPEPSIQSSAAEKAVNGPRS